MIIKSSCSYKVYCSSSETNNLHCEQIEVLWSRGEKPLPPLHPLLIKGRNLYRLNTMRQVRVLVECFYSYIDHHFSIIITLLVNQKWEDEGERQRILLEKHARGGAARSNRDARIQQKEMRKMQRAPTR